MEVFTEEEKKKQARLAGIPETPERRQISMRIDARLRDLFKSKAALENLGMGEIIESLIDKYMGGVL